MDPQFLFKLFILFLLFLILLSLAMGMFYLLKDKGGSTRTLTSLKFRVTLSVILFVMLIVGFKLGWIKPHSLPMPQTEKAPQSTPSQ